MREPGMATEGFGAEAWASGVRAGASGAGRPAPSLLTVWAVSPGASAQSYSPEAAFYPDPHVASVQTEI